MDMFNYDISKAFRIFSYPLQENFSKTTQTVAGTSTPAKIVSGQDGSYVIDIYMSGLQTPSSRANAKDYTDVASNLPVDTWVLAYMTNGEWTFLQLGTTADTGEEPLYEFIVELFDRDNSTSLGTNWFGNKSAFAIHNNVAYSNAGELAATSKESYTRSSGTIGNQTFLDETKEQYIKYEPNLNLLATHVAKFEEGHFNIKMVLLLDETVGAKLCSNLGQVFFGSAVSYNGPAHTFSGSSFKLDYDLTDIPYTSAPSKVYTYTDRLDRDYTIKHPFSQNPGVVEETVTRTRTDLPDIIYGIIPPPSTLLPQELYTYHDITGQYSTQTISGYIKLTYGATTLYETPKIISPKIDERNYSQQLDVREYPWYAWDGYQSVPFDIVPLNLIANSKSYNDLDTAGTGLNNAYYGENTLLLRVVGGYITVYLNGNVLYETATALIGLEHFSMGAIGEVYSKILAEEFSANIGIKSIKIWHDNIPEPPDEESGYGTYTDRFTYADPQHIPIFDQQGNLIGYNYAPNL